MKHLAASFLLCICLISQSTAASRYNNDDWRSMPFIEMMVAMLKAMNNMMGINDNSYYGPYSMPFSPAFAPGSPFNMYNGLTGFNNLPMSPMGMGRQPMNIMPPDNFQTGQNADNTSDNFWDFDAREQSSGTTDKVAISHNSLNGIWQALTGDVIAIYNNDRFIWSDGNARNIAGRLVFKGNMLYAYVPAKKVTLQFQFYKETGQFIVRDKNSRVYRFKRLH